MNYNVQIILNLDSISNESKIFCFRFLFIRLVFWCIYFIYISYVGRYNDIEIKVMDWIREKRAEGAMISGVSIRAVAITISRELKINDFKASVGWLLRFLFRNQLVLRFFINFLLLLLFFYINFNLLSKGE